MTLINKCVLTRGHARKHHGPLRKSLSRLILCEAIISKDKFNKSYFFTYMVDEF